MDQSRREVGYGVCDSDTTERTWPAARRRMWVSGQRFLDLLGVINLIPGPISTELAIYLGYERAGWLGLVAAGLCFIVPAMLIVLALPRRLAGCSMASSWS